MPVFAPNGDIVAGIGCSSGSPDQDEDVSQAGIDALAKAKGRVLFDIQHEINKELAAQLEMQEDLKE